MGTELALEDDNVINEGNRFIKLFYDIMDRRRERVDSLYCDAVPVLVWNGNPFEAVYAEDAVDGEVTDDVPKTPEDDDLTVGPSSDADVSFVFTTPADANVNKELFGGKVVKYLIGFQNRGEKDFIVKHADTSFRYPMDFNYYMQNFTHGQFNRRVAPKEEVTLDYAFYAHESFSGRNLGLVVNLHYEDSEGHYYINNVFNQTVQILEDDSGFSTETGFLFLLFAGFGVLLLIAGQHFLTKLSRKTGLQKKRTAPVEQGTSNSEVDFEWIPRETVAIHKSPKTSASPRARKAKKAD